MKGHILPESTCDTPASRVSVRAAYAILGNIPEVELRLAHVVDWTAMTSGFGRQATVTIAPMSLKYLRALRA